MKGWTPGAVYLCVVGYSTAAVILAGTWIVQARAEWPTIRGTEPILSSWPNPTQPTEPRAVKAAPRFARESSRIGGEASMAHAQGVAHNTKEASHEEVAPFPMMPTDMNLLQEKSTDGERVASAPKAINRAADRAFNSATRAPRLVGLVNAGRDLGSMRPSHPSVTLGRDRDFERDAPKLGTLLLARSEALVTPERLSRGVHHEPGSAHLPGGRAGAYLVDRIACKSRCESRVENVAGARPAGRTIERVIAACGVCGVPVGIGMRLIARESGFRQFDSRGRLLVSSAGAVGIGQIKPSSAAEVSPTLDVRGDEWQNLVASMCYLSSRRGTWREKVLAYRVGASGIRTAAAHAYASHVMGSAN